MSLTKPIPIGNANPAGKFITCRSGQTQGYFEYYKKSTEEGAKGENIQIDFKEDGFFVLDYNLMSVTGYNDDDKYRIISNEVRCKDDEGNIINPTLTVRRYYDKGGKKDILAKGPYNEIKDFVTSKSIGGKYTRCMYVMLKDGTMAHIQLHGTAMAGFLEQIEKNAGDIHKRWIRVVDWKQGQKGQTIFLTPQFAYGDKISDAELTKASILDNQLQEYLASYLKRGGELPKSDADETKTATDHTQRTFDTRDWRRYREFEDQPFLGSMSARQLFQLKGDLEDKGDTETLLYDCLGQFAYDHQNIQTKGLWKEKTNKDGITFDKMSLSDLKKGLEIIQKADPTNKNKLFIEIAIECKEAEQGEPAKEYIPQDEDDDIPF